MYYEQQNTKLVFELNDGPLIKVAPTTKPPPEPMPPPPPSIAMPIPIPIQSFVYNSLVKEQVPKVEVIETVPDTLQNIVPDAISEVVPDTLQNIVPEAISEVVPDTLQNIVPDIVIEAIPDLAPIIINDNVNVNISETDPSIYAKYFTNFDRIAFLQTNIKNYTIVVHYENKSASIPYSNHLEVLPIYMNVVTLMNPK
jgi:hypothetical protein